MEISGKIKVIFVVEMAQRPFTKAQDLHELSQQQCDLFEFETDCFCKAS